MRIVAPPSQRNRPAIHTNTGLLWLTARKCFRQKLPTRHGWPGGAHHGRKKDKQNQILGSSRRWHVLRNDSSASHFTIDQAGEPVDETTDQALSRRGTRRVRPHFIWGGGR